MSIRKSQAGDFFYSLSRAFRLFLFIGAVTFPLSSVLALPEGARVVEGTATVQQQDQTLQITASDKSVVEFNSYNIGSNESVIYTMPNPSAITLSRVIGSQASMILGYLGSNGRLILVNPAGITFGPTSRVEVGGLIASTLPLDNRDFLSGQYRFGTPEFDSLAPVVNEGLISASQFAVLLGGAVSNSGQIQVTAPLGTVELAGAQMVTVGISADNQVAVAIDAPVAKEVLDVQGKPITTQISNTGTLSAASGRVVLTAQAANDVFSLAINQEGVIRADTVVTGENGVIELTASGPIRSVGTLSAAEGRIEVKTDSNLEVGGEALAPGGQVTFKGNDITVVEETHTAGETTFRADRDLKVNADVTNDSGNLTFIADANRDGVGSFQQKEGTRISTTTFGDVRIESSGVGSLGNVASAGTLILSGSSAAAMATYTQLPESVVAAAGSLMIEPGVTLEAGATRYEIGQDWINLGSFEPGRSRVTLTGPAPALVKGSTVFFDFGSEAPDKPIAFQANSTQEFLGKVTFRGDFGHLMILHSTVPGNPYHLILHGSETVLQHIDLQDAWIRGPPVVPFQSKNSGNNIGLDFSQAGPVWTGVGTSSNWSDRFNWDGGFIPGQFDIVRFNMQSTITRPVSFVDAEFAGAVGGLVLESGYTGTVRLGRDLTVSGNFLVDGGTFQADSSAVVFVDPSQTSFIRGNNTFYRFTSITPGKVIAFEPGSTQTILGTWKIQGAYANHVRLVSAKAGSQWFVDPRGPRDLSYTWVEDSINIGSVPIVMIESTNRGNSIGWDPVGTWTNVSGDGLWSTATNWSGLGGAVPGAGDDLVFDGTSNTASSVDAAFGGQAGSLSMNAGYTNTVTLNRSLTLTASGGGTGSLTINSGILDAGSQTLTVEGNFTVQSGGAFSEGTSTVVLAGGAGIVDVAGSQAFYNLTVAPSANGTIKTVADNDTLIVSKTLTLSEGSLNQAVIPAGGTLSAQGDVVQGIGFDGGTGKIRITGSANQQLTGNATATSGNLPDLEINKSGGTLTLAGTIRTLNDWTYQAGTINATANVSTVVFSDTLVISGSHTLNNVTFNGPGRIYTLAPGTILSIAGDLNLTDGQVNTGTLDIQGNVTIANSFDGGTSPLQFTGSANQIFTDNGGILPTGTWTVNKSAGRLILATAMSVNSPGQDLTVVSGTLDLAGFNLTVNDLLTVGASGNLQLQGAESITAGTLALNPGSTVTYNGTGTSYTLKNYSYSNLTINGGSSTVFSPSADLTGISTLTLNNSITYLAGFNLSAGTLSNNATLRLQGIETLTLATMDVDSGTVEYAGRNVAETIVIRDFGATDYFNLLINDTNLNPATFVASAPKAIAGTFTIASGTYDPNGQTTTVTGLTTVSGGAYLASTATQTFNRFTLSGGTFTAPSGTLFISGNFTHTAGGTFNHNGGTVVVGGSGNRTWDVAGSETFNNFTVNMTGNSDTLIVASGDTLVVTGLLTHTNGLINGPGTIEAQGNVSVAGTADGGNGT
ncbi:MAG: filamentous hemagglutinin N-terminal domain-containing protein, partial [Candidatus Omnitrophica bacterium]|nr:filamentous hemagglutinin N-terminal domain-containing protein [Candidatus Omnitrophota bacterium]